MNHQKDYDYSHYKKSSKEPCALPKAYSQQLVPRCVPGTSYETKVRNCCTDYYHKCEPIVTPSRGGWEKNCSCALLTAEYGRAYLEYPLITQNFAERPSHQAGNFASQPNMCTAMVRSPTTNDFPMWLKIYSRASVECDHKLHWDMFNIRDLIFFDNVLVKLYELDLEELVLWYKSYKTALLREMDKRRLKANQQRQKILLYNNLY